MIDLDDIESRINEGIYGDDLLALRAGDVLVLLTPAALLAEVKRLRGEADRERAAVVAWLRVAWGAVNLVSTDIVSAEIERGEHRRGEGA